MSIGKTCWLQTNKPQALTILCLPVWPSVWCTTKPGWRACTHTQTEHPCWSWGYEQQRKRLMANRESTKACVMNYTRVPKTLSSQDQRQHKSHQDAATNMFARIRAWDKQALLQLTTIKHSSDMSSGRQTKHKRMKSIKIPGSTNNALAHNSPGFLSMQRVRPLE